MRRFVIRHLPTTTLCRLTKSRCALLLAIFLLLLVGLSHTSLFTIQQQAQQQLLTQQQQQRQQHVRQQLQAIQLTNQTRDIRHSPKEKIKQQHLTNVKKPTPCYDVHVFYYPWYKNPKVDKHYLHWNHKYIPHWSPEIAKMYPQGAHAPPNDVASNFYPALGAYSSMSYEVIKAHMQQLSFAGIGVLAVSYYPPGQGDDNGDDWQAIFPLLLKAANLYKVKVTFHIEPYKDRSEVTVKNDIEHIVDTYSKHPAFYRLNYDNKRLPLIYVYDSYHTKPKAWARVLKPGGFDSIRGTEYDCFVIGLVVEQNHQHDMVRAGFDGFYTYFASTGFTFGSSRQNWRMLGEFAERNKLLYIPSIGPGYIDTRVRPWNNGNTRHRMKGQYYKESWREALKVRPKLISITSFNEWHEGTQIEKAIPKQIDDFKYLDYSPKQPDYYLVLTKRGIASFIQQKKHGFVD